MHVALNAVIVILTDRTNASIRTGALAVQTTAYGYDFWYQPRFDVVISSEFGSPNAFKQGFDPSIVVRIACNLLSMHSGWP